MAAPAVVKSWLRRDLGVRGGGVGGL